MNEQPKTYREWLHDFWSKVDWSKPNIDLAVELDVGISVISKWRDIIEGRAWQKIPLRRLGIDWDSLDWTKTDAALAREHKVAYSEIRRVRMQLKKPFPTDKWSAQRIIDPEKLAAVDWLMASDANIARQLGVTRERIRQLRHQLQKPRSLVEGLGDIGTTAYKWIVKNWDSLAGKTKREIADLFNKEYPSLLDRNRIYAMIIRTKLPVSVKRQCKADAIKWDEINFDLPNIVLTMIYGFGDNVVAASRNILFKHKARWHMSGFSKMINDEEFIADMQAEIVKATAAGYKPDTERIEKWLAWKREYVHPYSKKDQ